VSFIRTFLDLVHTLSFPHKKESRGTQKKAPQPWPLAPYSAREPATQGCDSRPLAARSMSAASAAPDAVLAPHSVTRDKAEAVQLGPNSWLVQQGSPVAAFVGANGPDHIVRYNWNRLGGAKLERVLVEHLAVERRTAMALCATHDFADKLDLTQLGRLQLGRSPNKLAYSCVLCCASDSARKGSSLEREHVGNCRRLCGGTSECIRGCDKSGRKGHVCSARLKLTRTLQQVADGKVLVTFSGSHVPDGELRVPPALSNLGCQRSNIEVWSLSPSLPPASLPRTCLQACASHLNERTRANASPPQAPPEATARRRRKVGVRGVSPRLLGPLDPLTRRRRALPLGTAACGRGADV
jgi:hypothetical protein